MVLTNWDQTSTGWGCAHKEDITIAYRLIQLWEQVSTSSVATRAL
jgi:hypothetical protein